MLFNLLLFFSLLTSELSSAGMVYVKIGSPEFKRPILAFHSKCMREDNVCPQMQEVGSIFTSDMLLSNTFIMLPKETMPAENEKENIAAWKVSGAEYLVYMDFDKRSVGLRLIMLSTGQEIATETISLSGSEVDAAHSISDLVYRKLTGEPSIFKSKIAMICGTEGNRNKNLFVMDYDGRRVTQLTSYKSICVSPAWSPDGKYIAYTRYVKKYYRGRGNIVNQELYLYNVRSKRETLLSNTIGQNSGAAWSPDGKTIAFTMSKEENPNIYMVSVEDKEPSLLIKNIGLNVEPDFSPDGKYIVFSSSKSGNPELYKFELATGQQTRLTFSRYYNSSPAWSPMGDMIAFAGLDNPFGTRSYFDIFLVSPTGTKIERLTIDSGSNEDPSWSGDGRHLIYSSTRNKGSDIYMIHNDGTGEKQLTKGIKCYSPSWSKF
ncbi:MAG: DPP IV N-terminal domain-containing protein [bacterium]